MGTLSGSIPYPHCLRATKIAAMDKIKQYAKSIDNMGCYMAHGIGNIAFPLPFQKR
jgi:hypothetical protein